MIVHATVAQNTVYGCNPTKNVNNYMHEKWYLPDVKGFRGYFLLACMYEERQTSKIHSMF